MEEFENKCSELEKESKARTKEAEESHLKTMTLQDTIERYSSMALLHKHLYDHYPGCTNSLWF